MKSLGGEGVERKIFKAYLHLELKIPAILHLSWGFLFLRNSEVFFQAVRINHIWCRCWEAASQWTEEWLCCTPGQWGCRQISKQDVRIWDSSAAGSQCLLGSSHPYFPVRNEIPTFPGSNPPRQGKEAQKADLGRLWQQQGSDSGQTQAEMKKWNGGKWELVAFAATQTSANYFLYTSCS